MKSRKMLVAGVAAVAITMSAVPASALTFTFTDKGGAAVGSQARAGFEAAAFYWSSVISTNANVTFDIGFKSLDAGILGQTGSNSTVALTQDVYSALAAKPSSALDAQAVSNLKALTTVGSGGNKGSSSSQ